MSKIVCDISISADGYSAGHDQTDEHPFGDVDESNLHAWMFDTADENRAELDAIVAAKAFIMGRNGAGTRIFDGVPPQKFEQVSTRAASHVTHLTYRILHG